MEDSNDCEQITVRTINPLIVMLFLLCVLFLVPFGLQIHVESSGTEYTFVAYLYAFFWDRTGPYGDSLLISPMFLINVLYTFFRTVFIMMIYRVYNGTSTKIRSFIIGIVGELQLPAMYLVEYLPAYLIRPEMELLLILPIPILPVIALIILQLFPLRKITLWNDDMPDQIWWDQSYTYEEEHL